MSEMPFATNNETESGQEIRLRIRIGRNLVQSANLAADLAENDSTKPLLNVSEILPGLEGTASDIEQVLDNSASLVLNANISGAWHYSQSRIDTFTEEKSLQSSGKFGHGTYLGVGILAGETIDSLKNDGSIKHNVSFAGNILVLERRDVLSVGDTLRDIQDVPKSKLRINIPNAPLSNLVENIHFNENSVDAVMIYMDENKNSAEIVVLPRAVGHLEVQ